jgi:alpha-mannosidase
MPAASEFSEISVLIPGYSIEDLPTDLQEEDAASLLNSIACAWHPKLIQLSNSIPVFRQADSLTGYPGRRIVFVPAPSESWMPHEWRTALAEQGHIVLAGCSKREDWLNAIDVALAGAETKAAECSGADHDQDVQVADSGQIGLQGGSDSDIDVPGTTSTSLTSPVLADHFLALGIAKLQVQLLSRRRHHFVDTDNMLLSREVSLAANASIAGDENLVRTHLSKCFEHLRDIREQFYPMNCYLLDLCIPGDDQPVSEISSLIASVTPATRLNLFANARDVAFWIEQAPELAAQFKQAVSDGILTLLTGHSSETRTSLGSMAATFIDIERCRTIYTRILGVPPRHWARRRFGMTASLPALLAYFGFESALHFALDDGLYPDKERSQFDWQAPDGSHISAASRIPLAIDNASGFLRFADRFNESMQDDNTAALFLARLPELKTPWLHDLQTIARYAPVLGEFATMDALAQFSDDSRPTERYQHSEYLGPYLIQSAVLKSEAPVSGPALLRLFQQRLESLRTLFVMTRLVKAETDVDVMNTQFEQIEIALESLELQYLDLSTMLSVKESALMTATADLEAQLNTCEVQLSKLLASRIPQQPSDSRGLLVANTIPFGRVVEVIWPETWSRPTASTAIELAERTDNAERMLLKLPPGGFAWLSESTAGQTAQPLLEFIPREPPLAESLILRNRHFEVTLSDRTGGIASVTYHQQRGNRLSQQACFRYEREQTLPDDGSGAVSKTAYSTAQLTGHRILHTGTVFASIETTLELQSPVDGSALAVVRQITSIDRARPRIQVKLIFDRLVTRVKGNPWLTYFGCRFAWDNESASVTRSVMGHAAGFRSDRFESPDYVEISDNDHRVVIATHGRPYHRSSGPRMFDSLLIVESEPAREFDFTIDFDQSFPLRTAAEAMTPTIITEMSGFVPSSITSSWILGLSARNVELVHSGTRPATDDASEEISLVLTETEGVATKCLIRTARPVTAAFDVDADRSRKVALEITDAGVVVQLSAWQIKEVLLVL